jgi:HAE1 family hydrophobic/amphiphilic exporter-1
MTSFAFVFGLLPLLFASGAGANGNKAIGAGAIGGMLFGTLVGVFFIPVLFMIFESLQERISGPPKTRQQLEEEEQGGGPPAPADAQKPDQARPDERPATQPALA